MTDDEKVDFFARVQRFKAAVEALEEEHGVVLGHEDSQGAFLYYDAKNEPRSYLYGDDDEVLEA